MTSGYSGTPLWKKLGLKPGIRGEVINAPADYAQLLDGSPALTWGCNTDQDVIHAFLVSREELASILNSRVETMARNGAIWVSWPKKASKVPTDITEDTIREIALPLGLVDVKVCAVDAVWSGLKLMIRKELR